MSRRAELEAFLGWLAGTGSQTEIASFGTARSFRRRTAWCWNIAPGIPVTGEVHDQIEVDGIYVGSRRCLIAVSGDYVLGRPWCDTEKKAAWAGLTLQSPHLPQRQPHRAGMGQDEPNLVVHPRPAPQGLPSPGTAQPGRNTGHLPALRVRQPPDRFHDQPD